MTVPPDAPASQNYDVLTILLHWMVFLLVAVLWIGGETLGWFQPGALRADARSVHILLGSLLGGMGAVRFVWRLSFARPLPPVDTGMRGVISHLTHQSLYVLLAAMVFIGMLLLWATGDSAFNSFSLPANDPVNTALAAKLQGVHAIIGWIIVATVGLHVVGVVFHTYILRDRVLDRMLLRR